VIEEKLPNGGNALSTLVADAAGGGFAASTACLRFARCTSRAMEPVIQWEAADSVSG
jgi:hypothetical protein